jgi:hypothetical protein
MTVNKFNKCQESLDNDGQQIQQYQQSEKPHLT